MERLEAQLGPAEGEPTVLGGGITNHNFRARFGGREVVVRLPGNDTELLGADRPGEREANSLAAGVGVAPEVLAHLDDPVVLVTAFVEGPTMESPELREPRALAEVAAALRKIHGCGARLGARFDAFRLVEDYAAAARARGGEVPPAYEVAHAAAARIEATPAISGGAPVLCHDDLLPANFIATPEGIRIVDWEYAGMGNRWFDLGNFAVNNELGPAEEEAFLTAYLGAPPTVADLAALRLMRLMSDFREAMWGVVQQAISDLDFDFEDYADKHFGRLLAAIGRPEFEAQLEGAGAAR
ncbi:MAG TPA: choline kinase family protein [Solirubrobacterales bacterium]|nr:choline kinase family protein [Solirubrobacterales bacterium]